jgi:hypothetical protein
MKNLNAWELVIVRWNLKSLLLWVLLFHAVDDVWKLFFQETHQIFKAERAKNMVGAKLMMVTISEWERDKDYPKSMDSICNILFLKSL